MRTTVTLDPDTDAMVQAIMRDQGVSFTVAVNMAIRRGAAPAVEARVVVRTRRMGRPKVDLDHALSVLESLEDEEILRKSRASTEVDPKRTRGSTRP
ncbi:MAG: antitoxin [Acidimicrobiia bacterium]|nr:antitoxin [Acidimicrobiia bacterium]